MTKTAIISVDGHVKASRSTYRDYVERQYLDAFDDWVRAAEASGRPDAGNMQPDLGPESQWDLGRRMADLETQGVVAEVLFPNGVPFQANRLDDSGQAMDPELTKAGKAIYNRWLADLCAESGGRLAGQALVVVRRRRPGGGRRPLGEGARARRDHDAGPVSRRHLLLRPGLDPIWAACEETGLPISQHGGTGAPDVRAARASPRILTLAIEHSFFSGRSLWQLIVGGVFDRFPDLQLVFVETEVNWIGPALQRFDDRMAMGDDWTAFAAFMERERAFSRRPSEYWETNCYAGISPFHPAQLGLDQLGSGYEPRARRVPHPQRPVDVRRRLPALRVDLPRDRGHRRPAARHADPDRRRRPADPLRHRGRRLRVRPRRPPAGGRPGRVRARRRANHGHRRRLGSAHSSSSTKSRAASSQPKKYTDGFPSAAGGGP